MKQLYHLFILAFLVFIFGCRANDNTLNKNIIGTWDVYASEINNKPNGFMEDAWFTFSENSTVQSNLFEGGEPKKFSIDNSELFIDTKDKFLMQISRLENDTMYLEGKLKFYYMEYFLVKRKRSGLISPES